MRPSPLTSGLFIVHFENMGGMDLYIFGSIRERVLSFCSLISGCLWCASESGLVQFLVILLYLVKAGFFLFYACGANSLSVSISKFISSCDTSHIGLGWALIQDKLIKIPSAKTLFPNATIMGLGLGPQHIFWGHNSTHCGPTFQITFWHVART